MLLKHRSLPIAPVLLLSFHTSSGKLSSTPQYDVHKVVFKQRRQSPENTSLLGASARRTEGQLGAGAADHGPFLWRKASRQHFWETSDSPEPPSLDLKLRLYQYITWATYCSCCITAIDMAAHESPWSRLCPMGWFPGLASAWPCHHPEAVSNPGYLHWAWSWWWPILALCLSQGGAQCLRLPLLAPSLPCVLVGVVGQALAGDDLPCHPPQAPPCSSWFPGKPGSSWSHCLDIRQNYLVTCLQSLPRESEMWWR